jgi:translation initiation factor 3 subunit L
VEAIARFADNDHVFCLLYKEMYFRHVYSKAGNVCGEGGRGRIARVRFHLFNIYKFHHFVNRLVACRHSKCVYLRGSSATQLKRSYTAMCTLRWRPWLWVTPTLEQRCESWDNYCNLFGVILHGNVNMQLPNLWLWEMVDEFIYQFQSFCQYRGKLSVKTKEELALLKDCDQVWNVVGVLNYLQALVDKSEICGVLEAERNGQDNFSEKEGYDYNSSNVLRTLGYFSLIGLHRIHVLLGDYTTALKVLDPIDLDKPGIFTKVAGASVSTAYHVGFSYFMSKRYTDAIRHFNASLVFINRHKVGATRPYSLDLLLKKQEQMYALVAMCVVLGGGGGGSGFALTSVMQLLEEGVVGSLREKHGDDMSRMGQSVQSAFDELFSYSCPKFVTPAPPGGGAADVGAEGTAAGATNYNEEAYRLQLRLFLSEVASFDKLPTLRSFLKVGKYV